jgi:hypothetical protein
MPVCAIAFIRRAPNEFPLTDSVRMTGDAMGADRDRPA